MQAKTINNPLVPKLKKADRTRRALLDAALRVIGEKGFTAATVDEIVREAGVSKGVAYYHFKSKEDMATSILDQEFSLFEGAFTELSASGGPQEVLLGMLDAFAVRLYDHKELAQLLSTEIWRSGRAWSEGVRNAAQRLIDLIAAQLRKGQEQGIIRPDLDSSFTAASLVGMVVVDAMYCLGTGGAPLMERDEFVTRVRDFAHHAVAVA